MAVFQTGFVNEVLFVGALGGGGGCVIATVGERIPLHDKEALSGG